MAKLQAPQKAGFNADKVPAYKSIRIDRIIIDPEISGIFKISDKVLSEIKLKIKQFGYDKSQPVVIWKDHGVIVDGHTRLKAAIEAGLDEVPAVEKEFKDRNEVILYTFERQVLRRNLTNAEILTAAQMLNSEKNPNGAGRQAEVLAKKLGVSTATMYRAQSIVKSEDEELINEVKENKKSIKTAAKEVSEKNRPSKPAAAAIISLNTYNVTFLKDIVTLCVKQNQKETANMIIKHFLEDEEISVFNELLSEEIRQTLSISSSVSPDTNSPQ